MPLLFQSDGYNRELIFEENKNVDHDTKGGESASRRPVCPVNSGTNGKLPLIENRKGDLSQRKCSGAVSESVPLTTGASEGSG